MPIQLLNLSSRGIISYPVSPGGGGGGSASGLLSLDIANNGNPNYTYLDLDSVYEGSWAFPNTAEGFAYTDPVSNMLCMSPTAGRAIVTARTNDGPGTETCRICEVSIPTLYTGTTQASIPNATVTRALFNIRTGAPVDDGFWGSNGARINGLNVINNNLMMSVMGAYALDWPGTDGTQYSFMVVEGADAIASGNTKRGFFRSFDEDTSAILNARVAGWITEIPAGLQSDFGGTHLLGSSSGNSRSLNSRHSIGPSFYVYNANAANAITSNSPPTNGADITFKCLANYPLGETTSLTPESQLNNPGQTWTNLSEAYVGFLVPGTFTYAVFGRSGGHDGPATPSIGYSGTFFPVNSSDWYSYYWLFDYRQHLEVLAGTRQPHQVECYEHGKIIGRWSSAGGNAFSGGFFDTNTNKLYLVTAQRDATNFASVVEQYDLSGLAA